MPSASSLILLPPRHTARDPIDSASTAFTNKSGDDSFSEKLHHARKIHTTVKAAVKPEAPAIKQKAAPATKPKAESSEEADKQPHAEDSTAEKPVAKQPADADQVKTNEAEEHNVEQGAEAAHLSQSPRDLPADGKVKAQKPVKDAKAAIAKGKSASPIQITPVNSGHKPVEDAVSKPDGDNDNDTDAPDASRGTEAVKAVGDSDEDPASPSGALYGTGKVIAAKTPDDGDATDDATDASTAATAEVAADSVASALAGTAAAAEPVVKSPSTPVGPSSIDSLSAAGAGPASSGITATAKSAAAASPQAKFVEVNQPKIISSIKGQLLPHGGTMQLRLDPPELGPLQVTVHMRDGVMTASFETSSDGATKALSHSLGQLKTGLEAAGVSVEKLHVEQSTGKDASSDSEGESKQPPQEQQQQAQQEQQRREMVKRMWQKLAGGDPLDLVA